VLFTSDEDYNHAFMNGPWMIVDHYIVVQIWRPLFLANTLMGRKLVLWIRILELPIELV